MSYFLTTSLIKIRYVCEMCLIRLYSEFLFSRDLQMGFKNSMMYSLHFYRAKGYRVLHLNGSTVNVCSLDISKAFDKVNHSARHIPSALMHILINWYSCCTATVKWYDCISTGFNQVCGVCQGGVLSPLLFAVYIDHLIRQLFNANPGCCIV